MDGRSPPPCKSPASNGCLRGEEGTVIGIGSVSDVEVGIVDGGGHSLHAHPVPLGGGTALGEGGLGDVEERVDEGTLAGVLGSQDDQVLIVELVLRARFVEELRPHPLQSSTDIISLNRQN